MQYRVFFVFFLNIFLGCYGCGGHTLGSHFFSRTRLQKLLIGLLMMGVEKQPEKQPFLLFFRPLGWELADIYRVFSLLFFFDVGALLPLLPCFLCL